MISLAPPEGLIANELDEASKLGKVLIIDDDTSILSIIETILREEPDLEVVSMEDPLIALQHISTKDVNVILTDIKLPGLSGIDLLERVGKFNPGIQVILMTGYLEADVMRRAIQLGAYDFLHKPFDYNELILTVRQAMEKYRLLRQNELYHSRLEQLVEQRTLELIQAKAKLENHYLNAINSMINAIEISDVYTVGHSERVTAISLILGQLMKFSSEELRYLRIGAMLHDLGKVGRINALITKPEKLAGDEYEMVKQHPLHGAKIVEPLGLPQSVSDVILQHHERPDGKGYPLGISNDKISIFARIVSIADSYDAMTSQRAYRNNLPPSEALEEIRSKSGTQFDPDITQLFVNNFNRILDTLASKVTLNKELFRQL
ncbi:MAG TPA: response regulator [Candidatus Cloacimonadota bacterium]|nr:response regulator [Candidatus Cloacimonadota bacterium]